MLAFFISPIDLAEEKNVNLRKKWDCVQQAMRVPPEWRERNIGKKPVCQCCKKDSKKGKYSFTSGKADKTTARTYGFITSFFGRDFPYNTHTHTHVIGMSCFHRYKTNIPICLYTCTKRQYPGCVFRGFVLGYINLFFFSPDCL